MTTAAQLPKPGPELQRLNAFVGRWHAEGTSYADGQKAEDPLASGVPWTSDESYEWLPGSFYMLHRWDAMAGERVFKGVEIMGYDEAQGGYFTHLFDNAGNHPTYDATVDGNVWTFAEAVTRAKASVSDDGDRIEFDWEWQNGGSDWLPLCKRVAKRNA